jgi:hypothetical protein
VGTYHTREAFEARMRQRRESPRPITQYAVFYHAALMTGWEPIVAEQLALFGHVGLTDIKSVVLSPSAADRRRFLDIARHYGVSVDVVGTAREFRPCEGPTLTAVHAWAGQHAGAAVLYVHTKGASAPSDPHKAKGRRVMARYVVGGWRDNLKRLEAADTVGCAWQHSHNFPHWCGNFWAARTDWLTHLPAPDEYRHSRPDFLWAGVHSWRDRMFAETWVGCEPFHHIDDQLWGNFKLWSEDAFALDDRVPGFDYSAPLYLGEQACTT